MKILLRLLPIFLVASCATSSKNVSYSGIVSGISAPQVLRLMGDSYEARYSAKTSTDAIVEYYRAGEGPKSWKRMLALRLKVDGPNSLQQVLNLERLIREGGSDAVSSYKDKTTSGYGIDFIVTAHKYQEMNVFRYIDRTNNSGTISFQYGEVIPMENLEPSKSIERLKSIRARSVQALQSVPIPIIEFNGLSQSNCFSSIQ